MLSIFEDGFMLTICLSSVSFSRCCFVVQETRFLYAVFTPTSSSPTITIVFCINCTSNWSSKNIRNGSLAGCLIFMVYVFFRRLSCPILQSNKSFSCKKRSIRFLDQTIKCCRSKFSCTVLRNHAVLEVA